MFYRIKRLLPTGLLARSMLILAFPVVLLQGIMTVVIVERHFQDVTAELTLASARVIETLLAAQSPQVIAAQFEIAIIDELDPPFAPARRFYDYTSIVADRTFRAQVSGYQGADFVTSGRTVVVQVLYEGAPITLRIPRKSITPTNVHQLFVNMLVFGTVFTGVAFLYLRNQIRSITRLTTAVTAFGRGENLDYKPSGADEVRRAGIAFLAMRRRVERFVQQRTLLLSSVSHDLRTPLTRLRLELSMLSSDVDTKAMRSDLTHMENLLKEFLEFAKGVVKGQVEECDLQALLQERLTLRGQEATVHLDGALIPQLPVRRLAMARAIDNLILNAQLYANGLWCSVVVEEAYVRMIFEDDGPGIPEGQVEEMLQPFARGNSARTLNNAAGTGLGLAIVVDVVQAHGGTLRLTKSESYGGLRVQIELPR